MVDIGLLDTASGDAIVLTVRFIVLICATHGLSGVESTHYRHPLSENVFDVYMRYLNDVELSAESTFSNLT